MKSINILKIFNYLNFEIVYCSLALCLSGAEVDGLIVDALQAFGQALKVPPPFLVSIVYSMPGLEFATLGLTQRKVTSSPLLLLKPWYETQNHVQTQPKY